MTAMLHKFQRVEIKRKHFVLKVLGHLKQNFSMIDLWMVPSNIFLMLYKYDDVLGVYQFYSDASTLVLASVVLSWHC